MPADENTVTITRVTDDLYQLVAVLPVSLQEALCQLPADSLLEVIMDLGRPPQARVEDRVVDLRQAPITHEDLDHVAAQTGEFTTDNRAGLEGTLHRISCIRNRRGRVVGLTLRVGRAVFGTIELIGDLVESGRSLLLLGRPGVGKTTKLREVARVLADGLGKRVVIIDTSNEIGGDGDIPHPAIGSARRMQVPRPDDQHGVMIEAVENHMPEVIVVDEIGTEQEALAARTIAERGVQLVATAHGTTLDNLVMNPTLWDLVGGVQSVTLGDDEARFRGTQKTVNERQRPPTFDAVVEIVDRQSLLVHDDTAAAVDSLLRGREPGGEARSSRLDGALPTTFTRPHVSDPTPSQPDGVSVPPPATPRIFAYGVSRDSVDRAIRDLRLDARTVRRPEQADLIVALRARAADRRMRLVTESTGAPVHVVKKNSTAQLRKLLQDVFNIVQGVDTDDVNAAMREAETAVQRVLDQGEAVELAPCSSALRKLQHRLVARRQLVAESVGSGDQRRLVVHPQ